MKVGSGKFVFEAIEGWGQLPAGWSYGGQVPGVAIDSQDRVLLCFAVSSSDIHPKNYRNIKLQWSFGLSLIG